MIMQSKGAGMPGPKDVYTTAEAAKLCRVHKNTVIAAINRGLLRSMKTPGGHNRVARHDLLAYMRRSGIAVPEWADPPPARVLVVGEAPEVVEALTEALPQPRFSVRSCDGLFEAGRLSAESQPALVVIDVALGAAAAGAPALLGLHDGDARSATGSMFAATADRSDLAAIERRITELL